MKALLLMPILTTTFAAWLAMANRPADISQHLDSIDAAFVLYDTAADTTVRHNPKRCAEAFTPCSTFKIPNALISLEAGVVTDEHQKFNWDSERRPRPDWVSDSLARQWYRPHDLDSAFKNSAVWFFQDLALAVGSETMNSQLARINYGNGDISGGLDQFWLDSSLKISADEQVQFLRQFYAGQLGFSEHSTRIVKEIMLQEKNSSYALSYKTGTNFEGLCWLVGYVETENNSWFFALNAQLPEGKRSPSYRVNLVKNILTDLEVLPSKK